MDAIGGLTEQLAQTHALLASCLDGITPDQLHWLPPGTAHSVAATYAHIVVEEDWIVHHFLQGQTCLAEGMWAGRTGLSAYPPGGDWSDWARSLRVDFPSLQQFGQTVQASAEAYLSRLNPHDLDRELEMPFPGSPKRSLNHVLGTVLIGHMNNHVGEIAAVKGAQGLRGYPF